MTDQKPTQHSQNVAVIQSDRAVMQELCAMDGELESPYGLFQYNPDAVVVGELDNTVEMQVIARYRQSLTAREPATADAEKMAKALRLIAMHVANDGKDGTGFRGDKIRAIGRLAEDALAGVKPATADVGRVAAIEAIGKMNVQTGAWGGFGNEKGVRPLSEFVTPHRLGQIVDATIAALSRAAPSSGHAKAEGERP